MACRVPRWNFGQGAPVPSPRSYARGAVQRLGRAASHVRGHVRLLLRLRFACSPEGGFGSSESDPLRSYAFILQDRRVFDDLWVLKKRSALSLDFLLNAEL